MNYAVHKISLDIHKPESQVVLNVKQIDTGRKIKISLTEDGRPYVLTPDCLAIFKAKTPDGKDIKMDCAIDGNVIIYTISFQTTATLGEVECEIMLYNESGMLITSPRFVIIVNDRVHSEGSIAEPDSEASTKLIKLLEEKTKNAVDKHFEDNPINEITEEQKAMLDKLSEDENGGLLYDGKSIKRPYETMICETVLFAMQIENKWVIGAHSELPVKGVEIKTVRIRTTDYGDVDLRFMGNVPEQSSYPSYALNFCTLNSDDITGFSSTIAIIEFTYGANDIIQAISNYDVSYFEIDYYTD